MHSCLTNNTTFYLIKNKISVQVTKEIISCMSMLSMFLFKNVLLVVTSSPLLVATCVIQVLHKLWGKVTKGMLKNIY